MNLTSEQLAAISARLIGCPFCGSSDVHMCQSEDGRLCIECDNDLCMATVCFHAGALFAPSLSASRWNSRKMKPAGFQPPTVEDVCEYIKSDSRFACINPETFVNYYAARDWKLSNGCKVKDWKALVRTWAARAPERSPGKKREEAKPHNSSITSDMLKSIEQEFFEKVKREAENGTI